MLNRNVYGRTQVINFAKNVNLTTVCEKKKIICRDNKLQRGAHYLFVI
jgi:hypothetical protein